MEKFRKIAALLLALAMCLGLAACGGTGGKEDAPGASSSPSANAPEFDVDVSKYSELTDFGTDHIPVYPAVLCDGTLAMPYGIVETKEIGDTGKMEEVGTWITTSYSVVWDRDSIWSSQGRLEDVPISNASGLLLTLNSNIDATYTFPFDIEQHISEALDSQTRYIYYDEAFQVTVSESSSDGVGYILRLVDFASMDGFTFGGMALDTADNVIRVFGVPYRAELYWELDSGSSDTANAYLPYATYYWLYDHVSISMKCKPVINGGTATLSPSTLQISCY